MDATWWIWESTLICHQIHCPLFVVEHLQLLFFFFKKNPENKKTRTTTITEILSSCFSPDAISPSEFVVDEECILQLLQSCRECSRPCAVTKRVEGLKVTVCQTCRHCDSCYEWTNLWGDGADGWTDGTKRGTRTQRGTPQDCRMVSRATGHRRVDGGDQCYGDSDEQRQSSQPSHVCWHVSRCHQNKTFPNEKEGISACRFYLLKEGWLFQFVSETNAESCC